MAGRKASMPDLDSYSGRIAHRMRFLREARGRDVEDVVDSLAGLGIAVGLSTYYAYENGTRTLPPDLYPAVAAILGKTVRGFLPDK